LLVDTAPPSAPAAKPAPANPPQPEAKKSSETPKDTGAEKGGKKVDDQIAAAVQRRAAQVAQGQNVDTQIAAAVQRRAQQVQQGGGSGTAGPGGPIAMGPGSGVGGTTADLQYILYQGRMEQRIKAAWAWAGADKQLQAVVQFNLTPEGEIKNVHTIQSSGDHQYDASCERAVRAVNPLEAVPEKYRKEFAAVEMTFKPSDIGR
jgi:colicin import membrane protein